MSSKRIVLPVALVLLAGAADARTWTSRSGSQIEAELESVQGDFVVLRAADGRQFKIQSAQLSDADQTFIAGSAAAPAPVPGAAPTAAPAAAPPPADTGAAPDPATAWLACAAPDPLPTSQFPGLVATNLPRMMLFGLQYGPAKTDVLYGAFESPDPQQPPSALHLYSPEAEGYSRTVTLQGLRRKVGEARVTGYKDVRLKAAFGDVQMSTTLEFICGIGRSDTIMLMAPVQLARGGQSTSFLLGGYLNNDAVYGAGSINAMPLLGRPSLEVKTWMMHGPVLTGFCQVGKLSLIPGTGMASTLAIEVAERESGRVLDRLKAEFNEKKFEAGQPDRTINQALKLEPGKKVQVKSVMDLGPLLGKAEKTSNFY
ncbi:MAG: hypothetical protein KA248_07785 [Kiritimatiellae bacterium]|nr:hypothetical protein [Kiritimatiellia bacterium]